MAGSAGRPFDVAGGILVKVANTSVPGSVTFELRETRYGADCDLLIVQDVMNR